MDTPANDLSSPRLTGAEMEYAALRDEILRRTDQRTQLLSVTLTLAGAFLGLGWGSGSVALLIFPPLAVLMAAAWAQNEARIRRLNVYIRDHLEGTIPGLGYERFSREEDLKSRLGSWPIDVLAIGGVFLLTQLLAIGLGLFRFSGALVEFLLLALAVISVLGMGWILDYVRRLASR